MMVCTWGSYVDVALGGFLVGLVVGVIGTIFTIAYFSKKEKDYVARKEKN